MSFSDNLKQMPPVSHLTGLQLIDANGTVVCTIEHQAGQIGSLTLYNYLAQIHGAITPEAARKGLDLYAEHTTDARAHPGKHPNIDRLLALLESGATLRVKHVFAL